MAEQDYILLVDDEEHIIRALNRSLRKWLGEKHFEILTADSAHEAIQHFQEKGEHISVLVSDQRMPDLRGSELTKVVLKKYPDTSIIILSGHSDMKDVEDIVRSGVFAFIPKPWNPAALQNEILKGIEIHGLKREKRRNQERWRNDLIEAGKLQRALLGTAPAPDDRIRFKVSYKAYSENGVSGDYYDFYPLKGSRYLVLMGDVADKGVKAALLTPLIKSIVYEQYISREENEPFSPGRFLNWLNNRICPLLRDNPELFISFSAVLIDLERDLIVASNAGNPPACLIHEGNIRNFETGGLVLGHRDDEDYPEEILGIHSGETLVMFTDGLHPTGMNSLDFNVKELNRILCRSSDLEDHENLFQEILNASGTGGWEDDITLITVKIL